jgi:single-stranded-DNA-specific exonuclease
MCACGEIYQLIRGIYQLIQPSKKLNTIEFLSYAAIATIADISPIVGDNRIIVKNGLTSYAINHVLGSGLMALLKQSNIHNPVLTQADVSFKIAPKINAAGRISSPDIAYKLFIERNPSAAEELAKCLGQYNNERKELQKKIEEQAICLVQENINDFTHGILVCDKNWHIGVVGIVAARIAEVFNKPTLIVGCNGGFCKGSGRTIPGVNIKEILDMCPELFEGYGGHEGAVGITISPDKLKNAGKIFNAACKKYFEQYNINPEPFLYYDAKIKSEIVNPKTAELIYKNLYPYCVENNAEPIFLLSKAIINRVSVSNGANWQLLTIFVNNIPHPFKTFNTKFDANLSGKTVDLYFSFQQIYELPPNKFSNNFELMVRDIVCT